jgi:hypothetical protein
MKRLLVLALSLVFGLSACGGGGASSTITPSTNASVPDATSTLTAAATATYPYTCPSAQTSSGPLDCTKLPLGDKKFTTTGAKSGYIYTCMSLSGSASAKPGPWLNTAAGTWNALQKIAVQGAVSWSGSFTATTSGASRIVKSNGLPLKGITTGTFPIALSDPAHQYDGNPNHIAAQGFSFTIPANPTAATTPKCEGMGAIGITVTGVAIYNAFDAAGDDGVAREEQDTCHGHPDSSSTYHYHGWLQACVPDSGSPTQNSSLLGYAADGYGIYGAWYNGKILTSKDLDACHGTTSPVMWNGKLTNIYHYVSTYDFPYTIACYHGSTSVRI